MTPETVISKVINEMLQQQIITRGNIPKTRRYLFMVYTIGFDSGRTFSSRAKQVIELNKYGNIVSGPYNSAAEAGRKSGINSALITRVCRGGKNKTHGKYWKYVEKTD